MRIFTVTHPCSFNVLILIIVSIIGWGLLRIVADLDKKADKTELNVVIEDVDKKASSESLILIDEQIRKLEETDIELKQADKDTRKEYLKEVQLLRKDILDLWKNKS